MKTLAIFGSTGSIGKSSLKVLDKNKKKFKLLFLSCNKNYYLLKKQIKNYRPKFFFINKEKYQKKFKKNAKLKSIDFLIKKNIKIDYVVSGVSGYESIDLNFKLAKIARTLLIANKETIICGGKFFLNFAKKNNCKIIPIDSEHYCIDFFKKNSKIKFKSIKRISLMASGGPFLNKKPAFKENLINVLKHPNWKMGKKISVDSSTMANKVMEVFEAKILFDIPDEIIDIKIESKSLVHSIITLHNNINFFISHTTDMRIPISNSLECNNNLNLNLNNKNFFLKNLNQKKFPLIRLGYRILKYGHAGMIIFTVINEILVNKYLKNQIYYGEITKKIINLFKKKEIVKISKLCIKRRSDINKIINFAKNIKI